MTTIEEPTPRSTRDSLDEPFVVELDGRGWPASLIGGKAAALDRLIGWGIPVPPVGVVTAAAYRWIVDGGGLSDELADVGRDTVGAAEAIDDLFAASAIERTLAAQIVGLATRVGAGRRLAVRSSATVEDLTESSFAGQYRSVLDVDPRDPDAVLRAVRAVFASLHHPAPRAYRDKLGISDARAAMAVILMPMVAAQRAGVAFTADPSGVAGVIRVEHVDGLADALVAGRVTPGVVLVDPAAPDPALAPELLQVVRLAVDIERRSGRPQDVEWAFDGRQVWIVQARPITVLSARSAAEPLVGAELTTAGIGEMLPGALPPLLADLGSFLVEEALRHNLAALVPFGGASSDPGPLVRWVRGRATLDVHRMAATMAEIPGGAARVRAAYFGDVENSSEDRDRRHASMLHRARSARLRRRASFDADVVTEAVTHVAAPAEAELAAMSDGALLSYEMRLVDVALRGVAAELSVAADGHAIARRAARHPQPVPSRRARRTPRRCH